MGTWEQPGYNIDDVNEWESRKQAASERINARTMLMNEHGAQIADMNGFQAQIRFKVIFNLMEEMGWPRLLMDAMVGEATADLLEEQTEGIAEKARQVRLAAQAQGQDVLSPGGILLPGAQIPPDALPGNGLPHRH